ncbi:hypothetical protein [Actinokineospora sp. HUAS TT18]|uniref:hypothetical protein n=1 Tax=Actinokineospora sp. HUAS TT18 TaxID=3447451 RepID=UPI003F51B7ED
MTATLPALHNDDRARGQRGVERLAAVVDRVANQLADHLTDRCCTAAPPVSWLALPADSALAERVLTDLCEWMTTVFLRYADAAAVLPECWVWHPDVVEELLWLSLTWQAAQRDLPLLAEWHDRYRPGVVRRIKATAGTCSLESHTRPRPAPRAPLADAVGVIAHWWAVDRTAPAPEPTAAHYAAADTVGSPS